MGIPSYEKVLRADIWRIYILRCYKRLHPWGHRSTFVEIVRSQGDRAALEFVRLAGGSEEHCESLIEKFALEKQMKPLML